MILLGANIGMFGKYVVLDAILEVCIFPCSKWQTKHQPVVVEGDSVDVAEDEVVAAEEVEAGEENLKIRKYVMVYSHCHWKTFKICFCVCSGSL